MLYFFGCLTILLGNLWYLWPNKDRNIMKYEGDCTVTVHTLFDWKELNLRKTSLKAVKTFELGAFRIRTQEP
jgi:hypothetical protein